jgi:hypothetical protein
MPEVTMKKQKRTPPTGRKNPMKDQRRGKGLQPELFLGHVAQATDVHEQVTNDKPSIQEGKEAACHQ